MTDRSLQHPAIGRVVERELLPGEQLIWIGQADPRQFSREVVLALVLQLALAALIIIPSTIIVARFAGPRAATGLALLMLASLGVLIAIARPWEYRTRVLQATYAITNQRALVCDGFGWSFFRLSPLPELHDARWSFDPSQIRARRRVRRYAGRVDLVFEGERHSYATGRGRIDDWIEAGFLGLEDVNQIDQVLEEQFSSFRRP